MNIFKSELKDICSGYSDLIKELFFIKNEKKYFNLNLRIVGIILILGAIGILRNIGEVIFDINPYGYWYTMHPSILFTMFFFPMYLSFFSSFVIFNISNLFKLHLNLLSIFSLSFYLQAVHLLVPFVDKIAFKNNLPFEFHIAFIPNKIYFFNIIVMTIGIMAAWFITFIIFVKVFIFRFKVPPIKSIISLFISFLIIYLPVYHIWPLFNYVFNLIFSINDHPFNGAPWGYGTFFMLCSIIGIIYSHNQKKAKG